MPHIPTLCIVGLGHVGLPLACAFAQAGYETHGYDVCQRRVEEVRAGRDRTAELSREQLRAARLTFGTDPTVVRQAQIVILAIPTPVDKQNRPDLSLLEDASRAVGEYLQPESIVVYESTVYPGVTEEVCRPILEEASGLICGTDFTLGYSPERVNPGDKEHTLRDVVKVVSAQDARTLETLAVFYGSIVPAGVHRAPSIKVAEMAKAIENAQRDLNIAYMNEVAVLCNHLGIRTSDVFAAASTKWNFAPFQPGLVGGHCIGVDPYYLVEKARQLGVATRLITAGRSVNDGMSGYVASRVAAALPVPPHRARALVLGLTFKEDVPDTRNSKACEVARALRSQGCRVEVHDPFVPPEEVESMGLVTGSLEAGPYDALVLLVPHRAYLNLSLEVLLGATGLGALVYDLKSVLAPTAVELSGRNYLSL